jgi:hypothetical protein
MNVQFFGEPFQWQRFRFLHVASDVGFGTAQNSCRNGPQSAVAHPTAVDGNLEQCRQLGLRQAKHAAQCP